MKISIYRVLPLVVILPIVIGVFPALAISVSGSTVLEGTLSTGVDSNTLQGTVVTPTPTPAQTPTPTPPSGGGGGGGGGGTYSTPTPTPTGNGSADIDGNGVVDILDFNILIVNWGSNPANPKADLNHDGVVDILDFNLFMVSWSH